VGIPQAVRQGQDHRVFGGGGGAVLDGCWGAGCQQERRQGGADEGASGSHGVIAFPPVVR